MTETKKKTVRKPAARPAAKKSPARKDADSAWALLGQYHWVLRGPMLLVRPVQRKRSLGLRFISPPRAQLRAARRSRKAKR